MKAVYIKSAVCISAQNTFQENFLHEMQPRTSECVLRAAEPNYKEFIPPAAIRRMSKTAKMSSVASAQALKNANIEVPDAVIVGTGMGCIQDSEKFLKNVLDQHEEFLTPTHFIQSTHNTVAGQIALALQCHGYNFTYVNPASSLEFSLLDAQLQLEDGEANEVLVGATDEHTARTMELFSLNGTLKKHEDLHENLLHSGSEGTIWGEGSSFFVIGKNSCEQDFAKLEDITIQNRLHKHEVSTFINNFLQKNNLSSEQIDAVLLGFNGDQRFDGYYREAQQIFPDAATLYFKHLSGEYNTSSGFALFLACHILKHQEIPEVMKMNPEKKPESIKYILTYNQLKGIDHSLMLLQTI